MEWADNCVLNLFILNDYIIICKVFKINRIKTITYVKKKKGKNVAHKFKTVKIIYTILSRVHYDDKTTECFIVTEMCVYIR